jgi:hypothetical protein
MALTLVAPATSRTNVPIVVAGIDFVAEVPVTVSIKQANLSVVVASDVGGEFTTSGVLAWAPTETGRYTVVANDGTNELSSDVMVYATT